MTPGFYFITHGATSPCGAIYGLGGYAFDFARKRFEGPDGVVGLPAPPGGWGGDTGASYGVYDPVTDELIRVRNGPWLERLSLESKKCACNRCRTAIRAGIRFRTEPSR